MSANSTIIIGISLRFGLLQNSELFIPQTHSRFPYINSDFYYSLGLIIAKKTFQSLAIPKIELVMENSHIKIEFMNYNNRSSKQLEINENDSSQNKYLFLFSIQQLSIDQYSQKLMHIISYNIGGMILKLSQVLAVREDVITSPIIRKAFKEASDNNPSRPQNEVFNVIRQEFGHRKFTHFLNSFEIQFPALKAWSVGQIHLVKCKNNSNSDMILKITFHKQITKLWRKQWELLEMFGESNAIPLFHSC